MADKFLPIGEESDAPETHGLSSSPVDPHTSAPRFPFAKVLVAAALALGVGGILVSTISRPTETASASSGASLGLVELDEVSAVKAATVTTLSKRDLTRAKQVVPGPAFQAAHAGETNAMLNRHLRRLAGGKVEACESFGLAELQGLRRSLLERVHPELQRIHASNKHPDPEQHAWTDPRSTEHGAEVEERALLQLPESDARAVQAEQACYDVAMHFTHSLADADKRRLLASGQRIPLLPARAANETNALLQAPARALGAGDAVAGKTVFNANCGACHRGGKNTINRRKTLTKEDLEKYDRFSHEAIITQVQDGRGPMPRFAGRLRPNQIEDVAAYVHQKAEEGW